ncbi:MAG: ester cyclase [Chroococcidiopsidaceae cyanobacterium CP_BM_RX_35]|nr:ester cyclase [Chroococcidiopsidaceae cyanobacterium CP_BM_RX_35]
MSQQDNIAATQRLGEAINSGNLDALHDVFAPTVIDRDPASDQGAGPEGFIHFFTGFRAAFPDLNIAVEQLVADEDNVAIAYTITGTHQGDFFGIPATGRQIKARGVQIARFQNGQIVERWGSSDQLGILQQIGANPIAAK